MFLTGVLICLTQMALADESTQRASITPGGLIRLSQSSGDVMIEGWDRQEVEVTVTPSRDYEAAGKASVQAAGVKFEQPSPDELKIGSLTASARWRGHLSVRYHLFVPRDSRLAIDHRSGFIFVNGVTGDLDVSSRRGDIVLLVPNLASYTVDARDRFGIVTSDATGSMKRCCVLGERLASDPSPASHHIRLRMGYGGIALKDLPSEALPK